VTTPFPLFLFPREKKFKMKSFFLFSLRVLSRKVQVRTVFCRGRKKSSTVLSGGNFFDENRVGWTLVWDAGDNPWTLINAAAMMVVVFLL
jgi:hypothetical protein